VAVDANRRRGIKRLLQEVSPQVILLDDAHQHRYVRPTLSIVLNDYNRPAYADYMLPAGRLREPLSGLKRADVVVITKCDHTLSPAELQAEARQLHFDENALYAAHIEYAPLRNISTREEAAPQDTISGKQVILFTGIANPAPIRAYLQSFTGSIATLSYPDHHNFTPQELAHLAQAAAADNTIVITTEKDAARLSRMQLPATIAHRCYVLPMRTIVQATTHHTPIEKLILQAVKTTQP
jgi:tetraacyldisaccharide 4'-kinase